MLCRGDSIGVFQLEGGPMRSLMRSLAPTSFDDVAALVALYRPGPMAANMHHDYADRKNDRQTVTYLHPDLEEILGDTYGLMIYQESVMRVAQKIAGYDLAEADNLRKACGKKNRVLIQAEREKFVAGCVATGYEESLGTDLFDIIEPFADYAFNKSHAYGYGLIAYQTAWLKAHYPVEYLASLLTSVKDDKDKTAVYLAECRTMGIEVLVPDVNRSLVRLRRRLLRRPGRGRRQGRESRGHHLRAGRRAQRRRGPGRPHRGRARAERALRRLLRLLPAGRPPGAQQADHRVADQGGRLRLPRPSPPGPVPGLRGHRRPDPRAPAGARRRGHLASSPPSEPETAGQATASPTPGCPSPTPSSTSRSGWPSRRRCSGSTSATTR